MSYEHGTPHYNLPQTQGSDTRDWFDTNEAFATIDGAIYSAGQTAETAAQDLDGVKSDVQTLKDADIAMTGRVDGIDSRVGASEQAITRLQQEVANVDTDLKDSICAIEEASATAAYQHLTGEFFWYNDTLYKATADIGVGNQIVPDTNCKTTNITTELLEGGGEAVDQVARDGVAQNASDIAGLAAQLVANGVDFQFAYSGGKYGYEVGGVFHPFETGNGYFFTKTRSVSLAAGATENVTLDFSNELSSISEICSYGLQYNPSDPYHFAQLTAISYSGTTVTITVSCPSTQPETRDVMVTVKGTPA